MSEVLGEDIISEIEELLEDGKFVEDSELMESEELNHDSDLLKDACQEDDILEKGSEEADILEKVSEEGAILGKDSEEKKKKKKEETSSRYRPLNLPLARIKQIIKMDPDVNLAGSDAVFLIAKATELFIELLSKDAYAITASSKKKTIQKKDVDAAIMNTDCLVFLDGAMDF